MSGPPWRSCRTDSPATAPFQAAVVSLVVVHRWATRAAQKSVIARVSVRAPARALRLQPRQLPDRRLDPQLQEARAAYLVRAQVASVSAASHLHLAAYLGILVWAADEPRRPQWSLASPECGRKTIR